MKTACQCVIGGFVLLALFTNIYWDVNGKPARKPRGFGGVVETLIVLSVIVAIYWKAGAFTELFGAP